VLTASYQFVLVYVVDDKMFDGHDHDKNDGLGYGPKLASSWKIKNLSLFKSKKYKSKRNLEIEIM
jgi:hypothetical protein